jgi:ribulose-phosphate 3-epimerase
MNHLVAPSILASDFGNLQRDIEMLNRSEADWIHFDVMDGMFVPNISFGFPLLAVVKKHARKPIDVHLMIENPDRYIEQFAKGGASGITVHYEACTHLNRTVNAIRDLDCKAGVALNPHTPVEFLKDILEYIDLVLIMSVNPGFGGQKFIPNTYQKIKTLKRMSAELNPSLYIEIDGGVYEGNAGKLLDAGANVFVAGNSVFSAPDQMAAIRNLKIAR